MRTKSPQIATISAYPTIDVFGISFKIKIVGKQKDPLGAGISRPEAVRRIRPNHLRVTRNHGGGLWTFEDQDGQLYLGVLKNPLLAYRERRAAEEAADGRRYRTTAR